MIGYDTIIRPIITEKSTLQKESFNQITFEVQRGANRIEIKRAVERIFKVSVVDVRTIQVKGKIKRRGRILGKRKDIKKAIVKLGPKQRIDFFDGV
jgi:large subunit ribosomal protein L23